MTFADAFRLVSDNLLTSPELLLMLVVTLAGLVFYAEDFRIGVILHLLAFSGLFIWFYQANIAYGYPLIAIFICIVLLTFTLMMSQQAANKGAII